MNNNNLSDCNLYNVSIGVTPHEVERATRNEVLIIRGRRRKVRVPTDEKEPCETHRSHSYDANNIGSQMSSYRQIECDNFSYDYRTTQDQSDSPHKKSCKEVGNKVESEPNDWTLKYRPCSKIWQPPNVLPRVCDDDVEHFKFYPDSEKFGFKMCHSTSHNQFSPKSASFQSRWQPFVNNFEASGDVPNVYDATSSGSSKRVEISAQTSATLLDATIQDDKFGVIKSMEAYQKGWITLGTENLDMTVMGIPLVDGDTSIRQSNNDAMDHQESPQDKDGASNRGGGGHNQRGGRGGGQTRKGNGRRGKDQKGGGNSPGGGSRDNNGGRDGGGRGRKENSSSNWDTTTEEEESTTSTSTLKSSVARKTQPVLKHQPEIVKEKPSTLKNAVAARKPTMAPSEISGFSIALENKQRQLGHLLKKPVSTMYNYEWPTFDVVPVPSKSESVQSNSTSSGPTLGQDSPVKIKKVKGNKRKKKVKLAADSESEMSNSSIGALIMEPRQERESGGASALGISERLEYIPKQGKLQQHLAQLKEKAKQWDAIDISEPPSDSEISEPSSDLGIPEPSSDSGIPEPPSDSGITEPSSDLGISEPSSDFGISEPSSDLGISEPSSDLGISEPPSAIGILESSSDLEISEQSKIIRKEEKKHQNQSRYKKTVKLKLIHKETTNPLAGGTGLNQHNEATDYNKSLHDNKGSNNHEGGGKTQRGGRGASTGNRKGNGQKGGGKDKPESAEDKSSKSKSDATAHNSKHHRLPSFTPSAISGFSMALEKKKKELGHLLKQNVSTVFSYKWPTFSPTKSESVKSIPSSSDSSLGQDSSLGIKKRKYSLTTDSESEMSNPSVVTLLEPREERVTFFADVDSSNDGGSSTLGISEQSKIIRKEEKKERHRSRHKDTAKLKLIHQEMKRYLREVAKYDLWTYASSSGVNTEDKSEVLAEERGNYRKRRKTIIRRNVKDGNFEYDELSSDNDVNTSGDSSSEDDERDVEWLDISDQGQPHFHKVGENFPKEGQSEEVHLKFMNHLSPLFRVMRWTGRMPVTMVKTGENVTFKWDRSSKEFIIFCVTSILLIVCCVGSILSLLIIVTRRAPRSFYDDVLTSEFDKYYFEGLVTVFSLYFICAWSIWTVFEGGLHLAQFLTRWNLAIVTLGYDVTPDIRWHLNSFFFFYGLYAVVYICLFFFGGDAIPAARGASGFVGLLIFGPLVKELRVNPLFHAVPYFGLFFHLYSVWCGGLILVLIISYCLALQNAAKKLNIRIAFALGKVVDHMPIEVRMHHFRVIPYWKLWGEHIILTSLLRHTGAVFNIALNAFYLEKMAAMVVTLYAIVQPILIGFPQFNETFFNLSQSHGNSSKIDNSVYENSVPVRLAEPDFVIVGKALYFVVECWALFFLVTEFVCGAGSTIMEAFGYVRRHGTVLSKTIMEKRFIASLQNSYAPNHRHTYFIHIGYEINRMFITGFVGFVIVFFLLLAQFNPKRLKTESKVVCNGAGVCHEVIYEKHFWQGSFKLIEPNANTTDLLNITSTTVEPNTEIPIEEGISFAPCKPNGILPLYLQDFAGSCDPSTYLPVLFTKDTRGKYNDRVSPDCETHEFDTKGQEVYDCFGDIFDLTLNPAVEDECKIRNISTPNEKGVKTDPSVELVALPNKVKPQRLFCCFKFTQLEDQAKRCNLVDSRNYSTICEARISTKDITRKIYEELLLKKMAALDFLKEDDSKLKMEWTAWNECICQGLTGVTKEYLRCRGLIGDYPPCDSTFLKIPHFDEEFDNETCPWDLFSGLETGLKMQTLYKKDKYFRYFPIGDGTKDPGAKCGSHFYQTSMSLTAIRNGNEFTVTDCFGNELTQRTLAQIPMDDCQNLRLESLPVPGPTEIQLVYKKAKELPGIDKDILLCCFSWDDTSSSSTVCNLEPNTVQHRCRNITKTDVRIEKEEEFLSKGAFSDADIKKSKRCICQGVGGLPINQWFCHPNYIDDVPPCHPDFDISLHVFPGCSPFQWNGLHLGEKMQLLFTRNQTNQYRLILQSGSCSNNRYESGFVLTWFRQNGQEVTNCMGHTYSDSAVNVFDDCGNLDTSFYIRDNVDYNKNPSMELERKSGSELTCCFSWTSRASLTCNLPARQFENRCTSRKRNEEAARYEKEYFKKANPEQFDFKSCICQGYNSANFDGWVWDDTLCKGLIDYTCNKQTTLEEWREKNTKPCNKFGDNQLIFGYFNKERTERYFWQDCNSPSPDDVKGIIEPKTGGSVWDCHGHEYGRDDWRDDCGNYGVPSYGPNGGIARLIPVDIQGDSSRYRCCWQFQGFPQNFECYFRRTNFRTEKLMQRICGDRPKPSDCSEIGLVNDLWVETVKKILNI